MTNPPVQTIVAFIALAAGFGLVFLLSGFLEQNRLALPDGHEDADLAVQGKRLKGFVLGADGLLADWYWMNSLQYLGDKIDKSKDETINVEDLRSLNPRLLYPYLDNATEFDPHFMAAYSFGSTVLPAIDPAKAILLTEKGIANNPGSWRLYQYLGYIHWRQKDYAKAAEVYDAGAKITDVPPFMHQMAAQMRSQGGDRVTARLMYSQMEAESEDEQSKTNARFRLLELDSLDQIDVMNRDLEAFRKMSGRCPRDWKEFVGYLRTNGSKEAEQLRFDDSDTPIAPIGVAYQLNTKACTAALPGPQ
ncbi:MAG: tetratricopeptide repeat protein [Pyrinomonadaceae bacterium]